MEGRDSCERTHLTLGFKPLLPLVSHTADRKPAAAPSHDGAVCFCILLLPLPPGEGRGEGCLFPLPSSPRYHLPVTKKSPQSNRPTLEHLADSILASYREEPRLAHIDGGPMPSRARTIELLELLRDLIFPGFFTAKQPLTWQTAPDHVLRRLAEIRETMEQLIADALHYQARIKEVSSSKFQVSGSPSPNLKLKTLKLETPSPSSSPQITDQFLSQIPALRHLLALDIQAAYDGDPAARHTDETIFCYPGVDAIFTHRIAHLLHQLGAPILARVMSEYTHNETGVDIHPGANIGHSFFIDHGTGVVIGETTDIGNHCKIYQGVTLGAMSFQRDEAGRLIRGTKRHPTLEDHVTIYANATILGGNTVVAKNCIIGGSVFLTKSVPPGHYVTMKSQELKYRSAEKHNRVSMRPID